MKWELWPILASWKWSSRSLCFLVFSPSGFPRGKHSRGWSGYMLRRETLLAEGHSNPGHVGWGLFSFTPSIWTIIPPHSHLFPCPFPFSWKLVRYPQKCALDWLNFKNWKTPLALPISLALSSLAPAILTMVGTCWMGLSLRVLVCDSGSASWDKKPLPWTYQSSALEFDTKHTVPIQHYLLLTLLHLNLKFISHKNPSGFSRDGKLGLSQGPYIIGSSGCAIRDNIV